MPIWSCVFGLVTLVFVAFQSAAPVDLVITERMHHLRSSVEREWAEFPERADGSELVLTFDAKPNPAEQTLRMRHRI